MQQPFEEHPDTAGRPHTVLRLTVRNHSGTLSHVAGLFSRRAFNLEAVLVLPISDGKTSRMWLKVAERERLAQVVSQLHNLEDVLQIDQSDTDEGVFAETESALRR